MCTKFLSTTFYYCKIADVCVCFLINVKYASKVHPIIIHRLIAVTYFPLLLNAKSHSYRSNSVPQKQFTFIFTFS